MSQTMPSISFYMSCLGKSSETDLKNLFLSMKANKNNGVMSNVHTVSSSVSSQ